VVAVCVVVVAAAAAVVGAVAAVAAVVVAAGTAAVTDRLRGARSRRELPARHADRAPGFVARI